MQHLLVQFAATKTAEKQDIFSSLGIDWMLLLFQLVGFLILLAILRKFVYPFLVRAVDERQEKIEAGIKAAKEAETKAEATQEEVEKLLGKARKEASDIIATAKAEATASVEAAEDKAKARAKRIADQAREQIEQDIAAARQTLRQDTVDLVALATEKVVRKKLDASADKKTIETAIKEAQ